MTRPIRATIDLNALRGNLAAARQRVPHARMLAVIKANAYGHGLLRTAAALRDADGFAVLDLDAAVRLREAGHNGRILLLEGFFDLAELPWFSQHRLSAVVHKAEQVEMLERTPLAAPIDVFVKLNTGMNRLGLRMDTFAHVLERLRACDNVGEIVAMTHFADADDARGIQFQLDRFRRALADRSVSVSIANSATLLRYPESTQGWARPGIMLYGASPFPEQSAQAFGLAPVMTLESSVIAVQQLEAGDTVGYGASFVAECPMRLGVVACGYADGYPRHATTGAPVLVEGRRTRILGRVSMDMLCVDLTDLPGAGIGSPAVLWGKGIPVEEVAAAAGTVSYELLCALAARVPVVEVDG
jgi:alanine racemase